MDLSATTLVATIQKPGENLTISLRANQKITAQIISINKNVAVLSMMGMRVEARLTSSDQAALLQNQRAAQFLVKNVTQRAVQLQLIPPEGGKAGAPGAPLTVDYANLAQSILKNINLPLNDSNLRLAQTLLERGMNVTPETLKDLGQVLAKLKNWGQQELQAAVNLKAAGLPVTPQTVSLTADSQPEISQVLTQLRNQLAKAATAPDTPPQVAERLSTVLQRLDKAVVNWSGSNQALQEGLRQAVQSFARPLERDLLEMLLAGKTSLAEILQSKPNLAEILQGKANLLEHLGDSLLLSMAAARGELAQTGVLPELAAAIDTFIDQMRSLQFVNTPAQTEPQQGQWLRLEIPLRLLLPHGAQKGDRLEEYNTSRLRIAYKKEGEEAGLDPNYTQLVIQVDVAPAEVLEVDLSIVHKKIGALITASSDGLRGLAEDELPALGDGLESTGYHLETARVRVDAPRRMDTAAKAAQPARLESLNLKA